MSKINRLYGWSKTHADKIKNREFHAFQLEKNVQLPVLIDLRQYCPDVYDQGDLGSCSANALGAAYEIMQIKNNEKDYFIPSRLFIYYNERAKEGTITEDSGAIIADGINVCTSMGVCPETLWPYTVSKFNVKPPQTCYTSAKEYKIIKSLNITQSLIQLKQSLVNGFPIVFGFMVYASFESDQVAANGMMPMPVQGEECMGGHAVLCVGYDDSIQCFVVRNSWGPNWGDKGYFYMPYAFMTDPNYCSEFYSITQISK